MSSVGRFVIVILLGGVFAAACGSEAAVDAVAVSYDDLASQLGLASSSTEAFHATLIHRLLEENELEDLAYHPHRSPNRWFDVGVASHEDGSVAAARTASETSNPWPEAEPGVFRVSSSGVLMLDSEGRIIAPISADYESPPDGQPGFMFVEVDDPQGDERSYSLYVTFDVNRGRWVMEELGHDSVPTMMGRSR